MMFRTAKLIEMIKGDSISWYNCWSCISTPTNCWYTNSFTTFVEKTPSIRNLPTAGGFYPSTLAICIWCIMLRGGQRISTYGWCCCCCWWWWWWWCCCISCFCWKVLLFQYVMFYLASHFCWNIVAGILFEISIKDGVDVFFPIDVCKDFGSCTTKMVVPDIWLGFSPSHLAMGCGALSFAKVCFRGICVMVVVVVVVVAAAGVAVVAAAAAGVVVVVVVVGVVGMWKKWHFPFARVQSRNQIPSETDVVKTSLATGCQVIFFCCML